MKPKGRPKKYRIVRLDPKINQFSPRGKPGRPDEMALNMDEFEAIRLADLMAKNQREAAKSMRISQQTFSRILKKAHRVLADALVNGKIIKIQGGSYVISTKENKAAQTAAAAIRTIPDTSKIQ
jgi:predicted DNA-binding protein (UPF0251 family)